MSHQFMKIHDALICTYKLKDFETRIFEFLKIFLKAKIIVAIIKMRKTQISDWLKLIPI